jgi:type IV secretory pathway TrbD component
MDNGIMLVAAFGLLIWFVGQVAYFQKMANDEA